MQTSKSTGKLIITILAVVSVVLIAIFVCKSMGVFDAEETAQPGDDIANYGIDTSGSDISGGDVLSEDNNTIEMDEIPSNADAYADEDAN